MKDYKTPKNPYLMSSIVFFILAIIFLVMLFIPSAIGMDMMEYGFAIIFISFFLSLSFFITFFIVLGMKRRLNSIFLNKDILVHWNYDNDFWESHLEKELKIQKKEKYFLFILIVVIAFIVLGLFSIFVKDSWKIMLILFVSLALLMGLMAFIAPRIKYRIQKNTIPEAIVSINGLYLTGEFHVWNYLTSKLKRVEFSEEKNTVELLYSYMVRHGMDQTIVRIPVPYGKKDEALLLIKNLKEANKIKNGSF